ncbi:MAG: hypothetical protein MZW92_26960 [Comamonadaceae bacterium]|nr:hypothetical protein [Comamonadaceae bacterium]
MRGDLGEWGHGLEAFLMERAGAASGPLRFGAAWTGLLHQAERAADAQIWTLTACCAWPQKRPRAVQLWLRPGLAVISMEPEALALLGMTRNRLHRCWCGGADWRAEWMQDLGGASGLCTRLAGR